MRESGDTIYIDELKHGDQKALEHLFQKYYYSLCHFAKSFVNCPDVADEVVTDVFLSIWQNRDSIAIQGSIKAYLFTAVKNRATNQLTKAKFIFEDLDSLSQQAGSNEATAESPLSAHETLREVEAIIDQLPPQRRIIFKLNRLEGFRYKEIAEILQISVPTVQKQMLEAVKFMSAYKSRFLTSSLFYLTLLGRYLFP